MEPIVLFGMCGCDDELSEDLDFYKNTEKIRNSYNYFTGYIENYEEYISCGRAYKKNWNETQLDFLKQMEEIYLEEHDDYLEPNFISLCVTFGIIIDGKIIGFIMIAKTGNIMLIVEIFVKTEYRGQGIGKKLMEHVLNLYKDMEFTLHVSVLNLIAFEMYLKYDFIVIYTIENYYGDKGIEPYTKEGVNAYHMIRHIKDKSS